MIEQREVLVEVTIYPTTGASAGRKGESHAPPKALISPPQVLSFHLLCLVNHIILALWGDVTGLSFYKGPFSTQRDKGQVDAIFVTSIEALYHY